MNDKDEDVGVIMAQPSGLPARALAALPPLQRLDVIRHALAECGSVADAKELRDQAQAVRYYARQRKHHFEIQTLAAEAKLRCERRLGELLRETVKKGGDPKLQRETSLPEDVSRIQSHRWQLVASLSDAAFERYVQNNKDTGREITTIGALALAKRLKRVADLADVPLDEACTVADLHALVAGGRRFGTIYADPPWKYDNQRTRASTGYHYPTMSLEEIAALPVGELAAEKSHLHLWATKDFRKEAEAVLDAWGFEPKGERIWCKPQLGLGNYWRSSHEYLLLGVRGGLTFPPTNLKSWFQADRGRHSAKPEQARKDVEVVSPGPRLELFGRRPVDGWVVWGNEVEQRQFHADARAVSVAPAPGPPLPRCA
jgi:N6-adenosine-specific RNA methylase IME4